METMICSYSSDSRTLYKADIYKVLSMPKGFVIHFRYKLKYVGEDIIENIEKKINEDVVIFYTLTKGLTSEINIPIRKAKLIKAEISKETSLFHAYMQLGSFTNVELGSPKPSDKFFVSQKLEYKETLNNWIDKIELVKDSFDDMLFYYIKSIKNYDGDEISLTLREDKKSSLYNLEHGKKYIIDLAIGNPNESLTKLKFNSSSDDITANISNPIEITAQYDDIAVPIYIKSLNVSNDSSFVSFVPINNNKSWNSEYFLSIEIVKGTKWTKPAKFGLLTLLTLVGLLLIKDGSKSFENIFSWESSIDWSLIFGIILMLICPSLLFYFFNKK